MIPITLQGSTHMLLGLQRYCSMCSGLCYTAWLGTAAVTLCVLLQSALLRACKLQEYSVRLLCSRAQCWQVAPAFLGSSAYLVKPRSMPALHGITAPSDGFPSLQCKLHMNHACRGFMISNSDCGARLVMYASQQ